MELVIDFLHYLMTRPTFDEIAQHVVLSLTPKYGTKAVLLGECQVDGSLHHLGAFGLAPSSTLPLTSVSLWDSSPLSDAIRTGRPVLCPQPGEAALRYPQVPVLRELADPTGAWPLVLPSQLVGGIQLFFHAPIEFPDIHHDVNELSAVLALYLSLIRTNNGTAVPIAGNSTPIGNPRTEHADLPRDAHPVPAALTDRQRTVLEQIARGRTNIQIAHNLGFSESTIRQETIAIYRALRVHGRQEAVRQARVQGILQD
jgi:DNA-binding CsgD family transcriptional regulator